MKLNSLSASENQALQIEKLKSLLGQGEGCCTAVCLVEAGYSMDQVFNLTTAGLLRYDGDYIYYPGPALGYRNSQTPKLSNS